MRVYLLNANEAPVAAQALFSSAVHAGSSDSLEKTLVALGIYDTRARDLAQQADELKRRADETGERDQVTHAAIRDCLSTPGVQVVVFCDATRSRVRWFQAAVIAGTSASRQ